MGVLCRIVARWYVSTSDVCRTETNIGTTNAFLNTNAHINIGAETKGKSVYALAEKRCANYKTCKSGFTGVSKVNDEMVKLYQEGQTDIQNFKCAAAQTKMERIKTLMTIPLVQGTLRYAYKSDPNTLAGECE